MSAVARMKMEVSPEIAERRARRFWVSFICLILGSNVAMGFFAVYLALSDPSQSIIPNYYQKGLDWDKTKALWAASEKLGWSVQVAISPDAAAAVKRTIRLTVLDREGKTVEKAMGSLALFHHAHGKSVQELSLKEIFPGVYECEAIMVEPGRWEMTLHLKQEEAEYLWREEKDFKWIAAGPEGAQS
jgi:nitrogen fixation protein FixH